MLTELVLKRGMFNLRLQCCKGFDADSRRWEGWRYNGWGRDVHSRELPLPFAADYTCHSKQECCESQKCEQVRKNMEKLSENEYCNSSWSWCLVDGDRTRCLADACLNLVHKADSLQLRQRLGEGSVLEKVLEVTWLCPPYWFLLWCTLWYSMICLCNLLHFDLRYLVCPGIYCITL